MINLIIEFEVPPRSGINGQVKYLRVSAFEIGETVTSFTSDGVDYYIPTRNIISIEVCDILEDVGENVVEMQPHRFVRDNHE